MAPKMTSSTDENNPSTDVAVNQTNPQHPNCNSEVHPIATATATSTTTTTPTQTPRIHPHPTQTAHYITVNDPTPHNDGLLGRHTTVYYRVSYNPALDCHNHSTDDNDTDTTNHHHNEEKGASHVPFLPHSTTTQHRYSSFLTLYETLCHEKPGLFLPPFVDKSLRCSTWTPSQLERRRFELEVFLRRCVLHPELRGCAILRAFFCEEAWNRIQKGGGADDGIHGEEEGMDHDVQDTITTTLPEQEMDPPTKSIQHTDASKKKNKTTPSLKKWIKEKKTTWAGTLHRSPLDPLFDEMEQYISALEVALKRIEVQAEQMVRHWERGGCMWMELGLGCDAVGHVDDFMGVGCTTPFRSVSSCCREGCDTIKDGNDTIPNNNDNKNNSNNNNEVNHHHQQQQQGMGRTFHTTSSTALQLSTLHQTHHTTLHQSFLLPLRDHLKMIQSAKTAIAKRSHRRITYSAALSHVHSKKMSLHKYRITQGCENKILQAESSLAKAEGEARMAQKKYEEVTERVLREFDRFRREHSKLMRDTVVEFGRVQVEFWEEVARVWRESVEKMEGESESVVGVTRDDDGGVASGGRCFVEAARKLMMEGTDGTSVGIGGARGGPGTSGEMQPNGSGSMPMYPPPPVPEETQMNGLVNGVESMGIHGSVRYRDPLPDE
eukprot:CCRYP_016486-RA/>CCRYP_016486-RA protein AED:0.15 eAED:0.15 QI:0/-1/0/1/-1/1/1/0/661